MRCEEARACLGLGGDLAPGARAGLERHLAGCPDCSKIAADEAAVRALLASRAMPAFAGTQRGLLMSVPPPGLTRAIWRARVARAAPVAAAALVVVGGARVMNARHDAVLVEKAPVVAMAAAPVDRVGTVALTGGWEPAPGKVTRRPAEGPEAAPAPVTLVVVGPAAPIAADEPLAVVASEPSEPSGTSDEDSGAAVGATSRLAPSPSPAPTVQVAWLDLTVQGVTDLAGGDGACPGCDGVTPADSDAAAGSPVGRVTVEVWAITAAGDRTGLGTLALDPVNASVTAATLRVPEAAAYAVRFVSADAGFSLCAAASEEVIVAPGEGGLFATFRLWAGCAAPPPRAPFP